MKQHPDRYFGVIEGGRQRFVCDRVDTLQIGSLIETHQRSGTKLRKIISLGTPFEPYNYDGELFVYGYLGDGFRTARQLASEGWSLNQIKLLGSAECEHVEPDESPVGLWSDSRVASTKRTKAYKASLPVPITSERRSPE